MRAVVVELREGHFGVAASSIHLISAVLLALVVVTSWYKKQSVPSSGWKESVTPALSPSQPMLSSESGMRGVLVLKIDALIQRIRARPEMSGKVQAI